MVDVVIVDYGMCNLDSVARAVESCGGRPLVTDQEIDLRSATRIILPGVGAFPHAMESLNSRNLVSVIRERAKTAKVPILGICLGMQLLAERSTEGRGAIGLGLIPGTVVKLIPDGTDNRIPHMGWNEVNFCKQSPLFDGIPNGRDFYFVHSYHFQCEKTDNEISHSRYCGEFVSAVSRGCISGIQFHPEKSQRWGLQVIRNFLDSAPVC